MPPRAKRCIIAWASALCLSPIAFGHAYAAEDPVTVEQLRLDLWERDRAIAGMQRRMDELEQQVRILMSNQPSAPARPAEGRAADDGQPQTGPKIGARSSGAEANLDLEDASRALERTLVLTGGLLLPQGVVEVQPTAEYAFAKTRGLTITPTGSGTIQLAVQDLRTQSVAAGGAVRVGLPWRSQFELSLPVVYQHTKLASAGVVSARGVTGVGDVQATLSKQLLLDRGWRPGLIGSLSYRAPTASGKLTTTDGSSFGFPGFVAGVTAIKRHDPLVFFGGYSHTFNESDRRRGVKLRPGDTDSVYLGGVLAVSPDVSLRTQFQVEHSREFRRDGERQPGLGVTAAVLSLGGSVSLSDQVVLDVDVGAGVTDDSPDFTAAISLPIRF